jgi:hypothetical protein
VRRLFHRVNGNAKGRACARESALGAHASGQGQLYLLFTGSRVVLVPAATVLDAVGSPASGEEGFAPAGSIFAADVLAFAAAVPAVAFSPLGVPEPAAPPAAPPPAASNDETGAAARASAKAKANVLFNIYFSLCCALARRQGFNARDVGLVAITFHASR